MVHRTPRPCAIAAVASSLLALTKAQEERAATPLAAACNQFAADVHRQLGATDSTVWSPASTSIALLMLVSGARGKTATELAAALHLPEDLRGEALHGAAKRQFRAHAEGEGRGASGLGLSFTNDLWVASGHAIEASYASAIRAAFGASVQTFDSTRDANGARKQINRHVAAATNDRIPELLPAGSLASNVHHVLTNAICYRGAWRHKFDRPRPGKFHVDAERTIDAPMMHVAAPCEYAETGDWQAVSLPLRGGSIAFDLVVPKSGKSLAKAEAALFATDPWRTARYSNVELTMPAFAVRTMHRLREPLQALGLRAAFSPGLADFSGIDQLQPMCVDELLHGAWIEVDQHGVAAAAATAVAVVTAGSDGPGPPEVVIADHPFAFALRDTQSGLLLFVGRVVDPGPR